jgi:TolA-binding protein
MGDTPDTKAILQYTIPLITKLAQQSKKCDAAYKATKADLEKAIKNATIPMLKLLRPKLKLVIDDLDDCVSKSEEAKTQIGILQDDEAYASTHFDQIKQLLEKVTDIEKLATDDLEDARDLDKRALAAWDSAEGSQEEAEQELAVLKDTVGDIKKIVDKNAPDIPKLEDAARKAHAAGNQKALTDARVKLIDFMKPGTPATLARDKVNKFMKKYHYKELTTEAQYLLDDLQQIDDAMKDLDKLVKDLVGLGQVVVKVDIGKAGKVLAIASKDQPKLAKVLNGQPAAYQKGLDALAKDLKLDATGKELLTKLEKAQVV